MARAKRTDRTNARRRYRAEQSPAADDLEREEEPDRPAETSTPTTTRRRRPAASSSRSAGSASSTPRPARPGFLASARLAYHPAIVREDLVLLPRLLIHWSVLVSVALAAGGTLLLLAGGTSADSQAGTTTTAYIGGMLVSLFVGPPPFGAALLIGFMVPRATYLVGAVFGAFASLCLTVFVLAQPADKLIGLGPESIVYAWVLGILGTMFFSAGMAWYRRFLDLLNPNRGQRSKQQKPQQGRGNAPRNRLSGPGR